MMNGKTASVSFTSEPELVMNPTVTSVNSLLTEAFQHCDLDHQAAVQVYPKGVELFQQGSLLNEVIQIRDGMLKLVHVGSGGSERIVTLVFPGTWIGTAAVVGHVATPVAIVTCARTLVARVPAGIFRALLRADASLAESIHELHARALCQQLDWMSQVESMTSRQRFCRVIRQFAAALGLQPSKAEIRIRLPLLHWELAQLLAITPEHLSRLLRSMERDGVIRRRKGWILISSAAMLPEDDLEASAPFV
jgi:CRP-like cAMP-binding protein